MFKAPKAKTSDPVPAGNHVARLYQILHLGTTHFQYMGEEKSSDKVRLTFELCNEKKVFKEGDEAKPFSISREFGWTMGKKSKLRPFIEGMLGTTFNEETAYEFDAETLLGKACLLNVVHEEKNGNVYANILGASQLPKGMEAPAMVNAAKFLDVNTATDAEIDALPEFLKEKMRASNEYANRAIEPFPKGHVINREEGDVDSEEEPEII